MLVGLIPSDTDFRIFRDFGKVPGMDFAHNMNGYRYHTKYDHINYLSPAVLQRTGDNVLALVKKIASSDELMNTGVSAQIQISSNYSFEYWSNLIISIATGLCKWTKSLL